MVQGLLVFVDSINPASPGRASPRELEPATKRGVISAVKSQRRGFPRDNVVFAAAKTEVGVGWGERRGKRSRTVFSFYLFAPPFHVSLFFVRRSHPHGTMNGVWLTCGRFSCTTKQQSLSGGRNDIGVICCVEVQHASSVVNVPVYGVRRFTGRSISSGWYMK